MSALDRPVLSADPLLRWLEPAAYADHLLLEHSDRCGFLAEYRPGRDAAACALSHLMWHFKCRPSVALADPRLACLKQRALEQLALWLRRATPREWVESWTWVPIPPSRRLGDPDFDDRLTQTLAHAFAGYALDQRRLLQQTVTTAADHRSHRRLSEDALYRLLQLDLEALKHAPLREGMVLFDDVLTSGKHFRCCVRRVREHLPDIPVRGVFLMRRLPPRCARTLGRAW